MLKSISHLTAKSVFTHRFVNDTRYRTVFFAKASFGINIIYAFYNGFLGFWEQSFWFIVLCAYYIILSVMRLCAVMYEHRQSTVADNELFIIRFSGICLILLSLVLCGMVYLALQNTVVKTKHEIVMITIATYTFTKTIIAIINSVKIRKMNSPLLITIRNICCADAAASIFSLQRNMNASFGNPTGKDAYIFNIATGAAVCIIVFLLGFLMIFFKEKSNGKIKNCKS